METEEKENVEEYSDDYDMSWKVIKRFHYRKKKRKYSIFYHNQRRPTSLHVSICLLYILQFGGSWAVVILCLHTHQSLVWVCVETIPMCS